MFSPVMDSSLIAVAGSHGARILDIRNIGANRFCSMFFCNLFVLERCAQEINFNLLYSFLLRFVHSFDSTSATLSARFDGKGSRLLCKPRNDLPVVYNILTDQEQPVANRVTEKMHLTAPGFSTIRGRSNNCFAGDDDELVAASSSDHRLFIWSVPEGRGDRTIDQALLTLSGHLEVIGTVRYCKATSTLASGDEGGIIKLWTPSTSLWFGHIIPINANKFFLWFIFFYLFLFYRLFMFYLNFFCA